MSVRRSPPGSRAGSPLSGESMSGLNTDLPTNDYLKVTHRKRKQINADFVSFSQLTEFKIEIMEFFNNFGKTQKEEFKSLKDEVSQIKGVKNDVMIIREQLDSIKISTEKITREHNEMKIDISELKNSLNHHSAEQTTLTTRIDDVISEVKKVNQLQQNISELREKYESLRNEYNYMQQRDRAMNIEISQIPEKNNEIISDYVIAIGKYAGIEISAEDFIYAHRVRSRDSDNKLPKNIVVQLKSTLLRDSIISVIRKKKGLTTIDIGIPGVSRNIYVNEHLTPANKMLLKQTKVAAKSANPKYEYVWVRNCKIYVRKDDNSLKIHIKSILDLNKIK